MTDSALSRLFPVSTLKAAKAEAAARGLTLTRDPDCAGLFLIHPKGDRGPAKSCETLPAALAWAAAWSFVAQRQPNGAPFWGFNGGPTDSDLARVILFRALAACPAGLAEVPEAVTLTRPAKRGGPLSFTMRAGLAAWGNWPEWLAEESGDFGRFVAGDAFESALAEMAETLAGRVMAAACQRIRAASHAGDRIPTWAFPQDSFDVTAAAMVPECYAEDVARAAFGTAETLAEVRAERVRAAGLARLAGQLFRKARAAYQGHGKRDRMTERAEAADSLLGLIHARMTGDAAEAAEAWPVEVVTPSAGPLADLAALVAQPEAEQAPEAQPVTWAEVKAERAALGWTPVPGGFDPLAHVPDYQGAARALIDAAEELAALDPEGAAALAARAADLAREGVAAEWSGVAEWLAGDVAERAAALAPKRPRVLDMTPTWAALLPALLAALTDGTAEGQAIAREQLGVMAAAADMAVTAQKAQRAAEAEAEDMAARALAAAADLTSPGIAAEAGRDSAVLRLALSYARKAAEAAQRAGTAKAAEAAQRAAKAAEAAGYMAQGRRASQAAARAQARGRFPMLARDFGQTAARAFGAAADLAETLAAADLARIARAASAGNAAEAGAA